MAERSEARAQAGERAALLTPVAKAFSTDIGDEVASLGVQVHGGMGYIEETGAAQHMRDARIAAIYEGTNGIQAIDLVQRKLPLSGGATVAREIAGMRAIAADVAAHGGADFGATAPRLDEAIDALERATKFLQRGARRRYAGRAGGRDALSAAVRSRARRRLSRQSGARRAESRAPRAMPRSLGRVALARFFAEKIATGAGGLEDVHSIGRRRAAAIRSGSGGGDMTDLVEISRDGQVLCATLARPEKKNALTGAMYQALIDAFAQAGAGRNNRRAAAARQGRRLHRRQ